MAIKGVPLMSAAVAAGAYLHHIQLMSADPARLAGYYDRAMQMKAEKFDADRFICRGIDRTLLVAPGVDKQLGFAAFACRDHEALAALRRHVETQKGKIESSPSPLFDGCAFAVRDPAGNLLVFGLAKTAAGAPSRDINGPLQHITFGTTDLVPMEKFYVETLGFALADRVRDDAGRMTTCFVRSTHEHHSVGMFLKAEAGLDHHSYEAGEWVTIRDWADHLGRLHIPIVWGPGRHGPGNNLFIFIKDPDGNMIELSAEIEYVRDRPVKEWKHEPYTLNMWGPAIMRI
jgi:catechol 2,3-dioxygenase-like lactoylglutathione lyase family enzyme